MATTIKLRRNTAAGWAAGNVILSAGEPGFEKDTGRFKIGNGTTAWNTLTYSSGVWGDIGGTLSDQTDLQNALNAKANQSTSYTKSEIDGLFDDVDTALSGKLDTTLKGAVNGLAELDGNGKVPTAQLPSYVDDVIEVANFAALPGTGEAGKIYVTLDTGGIYRWTGSAYIEVNSSVAIADQLSTARTIAVSGAVTGSATFNGTADIDISTTFASPTGASLSAVAASTTYYLGLSANSTGTWTDARVDTTNLYYTSDDQTLYATNFNTSSDRKLKDNIQTITSATYIIDNLRGVSFNWKMNGEKSYGVVAQELEEVLPELVNTVDDTKSVNYIALIGILIEAVKELKQEIKELKDGN
jgi:Chaperone of endosialidase/Major tropism determinant N-terminal domain